MDKMKNYLASKRVEEIPQKASSESHNEQEADALSCGQNDKLLRFYKSVLAIPSKTSNILHKMVGTENISSGQKDKLFRLQKSMGDSPKEHRANLITGKE